MLAAGGIKERPSILDPRYEQKHFYASTEGKKIKDCFR
jgi:hypothetical protein